MRRASPRRELQGTQPVPAAAAAAAVLRALCDPRSPAQSAFKQPSSDGADSTARSPFSPHRRGEALLPGEGAEQTRSYTGLLPDAGSLLPFASGSALILLLNIYILKSEHRASQAFLFPEERRQYYL